MASWAPTALGACGDEEAMARGNAPTLRRVDDALWAELLPLWVVNKPRNDARPIFDG